MRRWPVVLAAVVMVFACVGQLGAVPVTETRMSTDVPQTIPDYPTGSTNGYWQPGEPAYIEVASVLSGPAIILSDLEVLMADVWHYQLDDLHMELESPSGTRHVLLRTQVEGGLLSSEIEPPSDFYNTEFDDQSATSIEADWNPDTTPKPGYRHPWNTLPITGTFNIDTAPNAPDIYGAWPGIDPLAAFNGENAEGTWTLYISDRIEVEDGSLNGWGLRFTGEPAGPGPEEPVIPEPCTFSLLALGGLALLRRRRRS